MSNYVILQVITEALYSLALVTTPIQPHATLSTSLTPDFFYWISFYLSLRHPPSISPVPGLSLVKEKQKKKKKERVRKRGRSDFHSALDHWSGV